jgi:hyaluronan synthase
MSSSSNALMPGTKWESSLHAVRQREGVHKLIDLAQAGTATARPPAVLREISPRQIIAGALRDRYEIPQVTFKRKRARGLVLSSSLIISLLLWRLVRDWHALVLMACAAPALVFRSLSWVLAWFDRPAQVTSAGEAERVERLYVAVALPVYNEDAGLLDRCLYALVNQTRSPQLIWVVDDGSSEDYRALRRYWKRSWPGGMEIRWTRQQNQGKRRAHAVVFEAVPEADIFVTVDSDTTLDMHALEEGLKPFADRRVMSVAGIEHGYNAYVNFLTRIQCTMQLFTQAVVSSTWSVFNDMFTNRGPFALYRASMVRKYLPLYRDEMFCGRRVILGDDSLLAMCGSTEGYAVQQLTAFGLTMWPETVSHHIRQRLRWARGRTVRNFWRLKYRPLWSFTWWFTIGGLYNLTASLALPILLAMSWPASGPTVGKIIIAMVILSIPSMLATLCFKRSDERLADHILAALIRPLAMVWSAIVLARAVRLWGTVTVLRQGWTTRQHGAELVLEPAGAAAAVMSRGAVREVAYAVREVAYGEPVPRALAAVGDPLRANGNHAALHLEPARLRR